MTPSEFERRLSALPVEEPDEIDRAMLASAAQENDDTTISLEALRSELEDYSGRLVIRIPRSLHRSLKQLAELEGVSLNQYMLYKLSQ